MPNLATLPLLVIEVKMAINLVISRENGIKD